MRRAWSFWLLLFLIVVVLPVTAQEEDPDSEREDEIPGINWDPYVPDLYRAGDKTFVITVGIIFPTIFTGKGLEGYSSNIGLGGMGSLGFNYFLNSNWFLGGEVGGMFAGTGGKNMVYIIPFGPRVGYQLVFKRFEVPLTLMIGAAPQSYLDKGYFGLIIKPGAAFFFRFNPDWSFGLNTNWWILPQWPANGKDVVGNFLDLSLSAKYHF
jgi:hypothetical protein